ERLGEGALFDISIRTEEPPETLINSTPAPEECVAQLSDIIGKRKITFEPGSATLDGATMPLMDEIAELLKLCGEFPLEIQGHTDSQGREVMNQELSQARAQAVLDALFSRRVLTGSYTARGYGEAQPIADNGSETGREANRRIEFVLIRSAPSPEEITTLERSEQSLPEDDTQ
ncbi:MAG: OmpA family protein, partial [Paracoccaceae bacterium]